MGVGAKIVSRASRQRGITLRDEVGQSDGVFLGCRDWYEDSPARDELSTIEVTK